MTLKGETNPPNPPTTMSFGGALEALEDGHAVQRPGWAADMHFLFFLDNQTLTVAGAPLDMFYIINTQLPVEEYIAEHVMEDGDAVIKHWVPTQQDLIADDWSIVAPQSPGHEPT